MRSTIALFFLLALWLNAPRVARAADASASLSVTRATGAESCIDREPLERAVSKRLRRNPFGLSPAELRIDIHIARNARGWVAVLDLDDGKGTPLGRRTLTTQAEHCSALDDSLALVIALLVETPPPPLENAPAAENPPSAELSTPPPPAPPQPPKANKPTEIELPRETYAPRAPWQFHQSVTGIAALGLLPGAAFGAEVAVAATPPRAPKFRLFGNLLPPRTVHALPDSGAHFSFASVGLELCGTPARGKSLSWFVCGAQSVGRVSANAFGFDRNGTEHQLTFALGAHTGVRLEFGSGFGLRAGARAEVPVSRRVFVYRTASGLNPRLFQMSPLDGIFELGLEFTD